MATRTMGEAGTGGMNKTQAIRAELQKDPGAMPKPLAEKLRAMGYDVKPQYVSVLKNTLKREAEGQTPATTGRQGRPPAATKQAAAPVSGDLSFESLRKAKELSAELGGIEKAKEALDALIQLTG